MNVDRGTPAVLQFRALRRYALLLAVVVLAASPVVEPSLPPRVLWNQPYPPFRMIGNIYYVGVAQLSSFLIVTSEGSVLLDGALKESAPLIARNITHLGFRLSDIKYLLNSHVHYDHGGGLAELKRLTGATMVASAGDAKWLQIGSSDLPPVRVDRIIGDAETLVLGEARITARITPGHTPGCTTWTMTVEEQGRRHNVIFYCGTSIVQPLVDNARYPSIVEDYERSFATFKSMDADVFFEGHPERFNMDDKRRQMKPSRPNPFVDPGEFQRFVQREELRFQSELQRQRAAQRGRLAAVR